MIKDCQYCLTPLSLTQQQYHQYLCPSQQFQKQTAQLEFLLQNSKISSQQFQQIKEILKQNLKFIYKEDLINSNQMFNDSIQKQEYFEDDIFFLNSNVSNYFQNNITNQISNFQQNPNTQDESFFYSHSEFFEYISRIDKQIDDRSVIVKKELFNISELLQNLSFHEQYSTTLPKQNLKCQSCSKTFKNLKTLHQHIKNLHKNKILISKKSKQKQQKVKPSQAY